MENPSARGGSQIQILSSWIFDLTKRSRSVGRLCFLYINMYVSYTRIPMIPYAFSSRKKNCNSGDGDQVGKTSVLTEKTMLGKHTGHKQSDVRTVTSHRCGAERVASQSNKSRSLFGNPMISNLTSVHAISTFRAATHLQSEAPCRKARCYAYYVPMQKFSFMHRQPGEKATPRVYLLLYIRLDYNILSE